MSGFLSKFKLDAHHKIERFGVLFITLVVCLSLVTVSIMVKAHNDSRQQLTAQAVYTTEFTMSRTGSKGSVIDIYSDDAHTKTFILLKFDDISKISTNAENYQMFLTGSSLSMKPSHLNINPSGSIYMFGSTGYMGIYLAEAGGFKSQILDLVVRSNKEITSADEKNVNANDGTFAKYDQFRVYFNAGGANTSKADFLNSGEIFTVGDIYEELITRPQEMVLRDSMTAEIRTMKSDMDLISEYTRRVQDDGIVLNSPPEAILGDVITDKDGNIVASMNPADQLTKISDDTVLYLNTDYTAVRGVNFTWQDSFIRDGYLPGMMGDKTPTQYLSDVVNNEESKSDVFETGKLVWYRTSGAVFTPDNLSQTDISTNTDISNLMSAWSTYWEHKKSYQTGTLINLLKLEAEALSADANFTINNNEGVLSNWQSD